MSAEPEGTKSRTRELVEYIEEVVYDFTTDHVFLDWMDGEYTPMGRALAERVAAVLGEDPSWAEVSITELLLKREGLEITCARLTGELERARGLAVRLEQEVADAAAGRQRRAF